MLGAWMLATTYLEPPLLHRRSAQQIENVKYRYSAWKYKLAKLPDAHPRLAELSLLPLLLLL